MDDDDLWTAERRLWLDGAEAYAQVLDPACVMAFGPPVGLMSGPQIAESLKGAPRWARVEMAQQRAARASQDVAVLAYHATANREGGEPYQAYCTSTYRRDGETWRLIQHQQTPAQSD